jgi:hypothetical protein
MEIVRLPVFIAVLLVACRSTPHESAAADQNKPAIHRRINVY